VVVRQGLVASVETAASALLSGGLVEIDGRGKFLLPGLWDMHTHSSTLARQYYHLLPIANGVTGVREMWGCMSEPESFVACIDDRQRWTDSLRDHSGLSPRFISQSSFQINGGNGVQEGYPEFFKVLDEHDAQRCKVLMREMANSDTWWVPTLQVLKMSAYAGNESFRRDRRLKYIPYLIREGIWVPDADRAAYGCPTRIAQPDRHRMIQVRAFSTVCIGWHWAT
jgi:hypothetical protein